MMGRTPKGAWRTRKVKSEPCPECGQHYSKQRMGIHRKEAHPTSKRGS